MKYTKQISKKWRKLTVVFLLLNFIASPLLYAFPEEECNSACEIVMPFHDCSSESMHMDDACCDVMATTSSKMEHTSSAESGMKISDIHCSKIFSSKTASTYIIPKTIDSKVDFIILPMFDVEDDITSIVVSNYSQYIFIDSSPPIYLMISSFLN